MGWAANGIVQYAMNVSTESYKRWQVKSLCLRLVPREWCLWLSYMYIEMRMDPPLVGEKLPVNIEEDNANDLRTLAFQMCTLLLAMY